MYLRNSIAGIAIVLLLLSHKQAATPAAQYIRIDQLGYTPGGSKVAVWTVHQYMINL